MRLLFAATTLSLLLGAVGQPHAAAGETPAAPAAAASSDAAALHAKRTACRKQARGKKLIGAEKTAFLKNCLAAK
jgi:hypothetical protein